MDFRKSEKEALMERKDELWLKYLASCGESSRRQLAGWSFGFFFGPAAPMAGMFGLMAVSTATGVFDFPSMIFGKSPAGQALSANAPAIQTTAAVSQQADAPSAAPVQNAPLPQYSGILDPPRENPLLPLLKLSALGRENNR